MSADTDGDKIPDRILFLAPTRRDAEITSSLLTKAAMACVPCKDVHHLVRELNAGAGAVLLTEEVLAAEGMQDLLNTLK
jgi:hypothetical protein